jgi:hypothetical protein
MPLGTGTPGDSFGLLGGVLIAANLAAVSYVGDIGVPNPGNTSGPLFPGNWTLLSGEPGALLRLVQFVAAVPDAAELAVWTDEWPQLSLVDLPFFLVWFDGNLGPGIPYELHLDALGVATGGCSCASLMGLVLRRDTRQTDARDGDRLQDLANPFVSRDVLRLPPLLGTYQLTDTGDFGLDKSLEASLRKRVLRRVTTAAGGFFHLPDYGAGQKIKGLLTVDAVDRLRARIRAQILQEPDVLEAVVVLALAAGTTGTVLATIRVTPNGGDPLGLVVPIAIP